MRDGIRGDIAARAFLTLGALLPYWRLLSFGVIYVTDDIFTSDIFNGELPGRVLIGQLIRHGQMPEWTSQLCSGIPIAGSAVDPIGLSAFSLLPPAAALDLFVIVLLLVAAHGAFGLARRLGADRPGAVLAGLAFAGSGYIACQLKHLNIISTIVWLPVGLTLIDRALGAGGSRTPTHARRALFMAAFGLVFAEQALCGFPQSAYICALVYGSFALFRSMTDRQRIGSLSLRLTLLGGLGIAAILGAAAGAVALLPLSEAGRVSDRAATLGWAWATTPAYWPPNILTFLAPYVHGDISDHTYTGPSIFWEDYGYVGVATFLLALYGGAREWRRPVVLFSILLTVVAYLFVLGAATPVFRVAYLIVPGMKLFRLPTRFLIVVELGLALLGAIGLTRLGADLERHFKNTPSPLPRVIVLAVCLGTALDLFLHQPRQNPMVSGQDWLAAPSTVGTVRADSSQPRTFTPRHNELHRRAFVLARGWANVDPYFELRDVLEPNLGGGLWNTPSADCYAGISASWHVNVWGDHSREGLVSQLANLDVEAQALRVHPGLAKFFRTYGVSHVLSPFPQQGAAFTLVAHERNTYIYRVEGAARMRFVRGARHVKTDQEAVTRLLDTAFDPDREILLHDAPDSVHPGVEDVGAASANIAASRPVVTYEDSRQLVIEADAPEDGFLLLADSFYPGWTAHVDGRPIPIYRANLSVRGIQLPKGRHEVRFTFDAPGFARGLQITLLAVSILLIWAGGAVYVDRRVRR
jgi:hypothetical protein